MTHHPGIADPPSDDDKPDPRPVDEQAVEMLEKLVPKDRRETLRKAREAGRQQGKRGK
jgi:hypothetical protein